MDVKLGNSQISRLSTVSSGSVWTSIQIVVRQVYRRGKLGACEQASQCRDIAAHHVFFQRRPPPSHKHTVIAPLGVAAAVAGPVCKDKLNSFLHKPKCVHVVEETAWPETGVVGSRIIKKRTILGVDILNQG